MPSQDRVHIDTIIPARHQPRQQVGDVSSLANSIVESGIFHTALTTKRGKNGKLILISGHRRLEAARAAAQHDRTYDHVPVLIYEAGELDPVTEWKMMIDENKEREPLKPIEEALAFFELKLRMDCEALCHTLGYDFDARVASLVGLADWQAEYEYLAGAMRQSGRTAESYQTKWIEFDRYAGLSTTSRKRYWQLAHAPLATREYLLKTNLPLTYQVAILAAPESRQLDLASAVAEERGDSVPLVAVQTLARLLYQHPHVPDVPGVLQLAVRLVAAHPNAGVGTLTEMLVAQLPIEGDTKVAERDNGSGSSNTAPLVMPPPHEQVPPTNDEEIETADGDKARSSGLLLNDEVYTNGRAAAMRLVADANVIARLEAILDHYREHGDKQRLRQEVEWWLTEMRRDTGPLAIAA